jgi:hypothetical protein
MAVPKKPVPEVVDLSHLTYDSTQRVEYLVKEGHLRGTELYLTAGLVNEMEALWGGNLLAIRTITDRQNWFVYMFYADPKHAEATAVRKSDTMASAALSFYVPLQILGLKLRKDRLVVLEPSQVDVTGIGKAYCFDLRGARAKKRSSAATAAPTGS